MKLELELELNNLWETLREQLVKAACSLKVQRWINLCFANYRHSRFHLDDGCYYRASSSCRRCCCRCLCSCLIIVNIIMLVIVIIDTVNISWEMLMELEVKKLVKLFKRANKRNFASKICSRLLSLSLSVDTFCRQMRHREEMGNRGN